MKPAAAYSRTISSASAIASSAGRSRHGFGPEVVAAQQHPVHRDPGRPRRAVDELAEVRRPHPGVAAVLIDLIGGRLDEHGLAGAARLAHRRLEHQRVRGAHRGDADRLAAPVARYQ